MSFDMKETIGITINSDDYKGLLDGLTEIKLSKKSDALRYVRPPCDAACWVAITAKDKNGTKWKKLKNQRLRRIGRKILGW